MKRKVGTSIFFVCMLIVMWGLLVTFDAIRLYCSDNYTKPLITIEKITSKDNITFIGLGYNINYKKTLNIISKGNDYVVTEVTELTTTFKVLNLISVWKK